MESVIFKKQAACHPAMEPQDAVKMCFQAAFGAEHLLEDRETAREWFIKEYGQVQPRIEEALTEDISEDFARVNLGAWKARQLPSEWLFGMFVETASEANTTYCSRELFERNIKIIGQLTAEGIFGFGEDTWEEYLRSYPVKEPVPVHHSEGYRRVEKPAYRLVGKQMCALIPLLEVIHKKRQEQDKGKRGSFVLAIDGPCTSGKTTLAKCLAAVTGAGIVHMDDFFLPGELRTEERLKEPGGNVHYERFLEEVYPFFKRGENFSYRRFDCSRMALAEERSVGGNGFVIVEGSYSCHPKFGDYADVRVYTDVDPEEQLARILKRDGTQALEVFRERWIPMEETYFKTYPIRAQADIEM